MDFGISEEQEQLKNSAREFLAGECPTTVVRKIMATEDGAAPELDQIDADLHSVGFAREMHDARLIADHLGNRHGIGAQARQPGERLMTMAGPPRFLPPCPKALFVR